jgi:hypothetical protein
MEVMRIKLTCWKMTKNLTVMEIEKKLWKTTQTIRLRRMLKN